MFLPRYSVIQYFSICIELVDLSFSQARPQKLPFASLLPAVPPGTLVQDLKWNPAHVSMLAVCMSDGSMQILEVADGVRVQAELPAASGITCSE